MNVRRSARATACTAAKSDVCLTHGRSGIRAGTVSARGYSNVYVVAVADSGTSDENDGSQQRGRVVTMLVGVLGGGLSVLVLVGVALLIVLGLIAGLFMAVAYAFAGWHAF